MAKNIGWCFPERGRSGERLRGHNSRRRCRGVIGKLRHRTLLTKVVLFVIIGGLAYGWICPLLPPSVIAAIRKNSPTVDGDYTFTLRSAAGVAILAIGFRGSLVHRASLASFAPSAILPVVRVALHRDRGPQYLARVRCAPATSLPNSHGPFAVYAGRLWGGGIAASGRPGEPG